MLMNPIHVWLDLVTKRKWCHKKITEYKRLCNIKARLERDYGREKNSNIRYNKKPLMVW